jgi:hypothetical protein
MVSRGPMMRTALVSTGLFVAACSVGEVDDDGACVARLAPPQVEAHQHANIATNPTHAGENCIVGGCHLNNNLGLNAPGYQFGGTVYVTGTTNPSAGATVRIKSGTTVLKTVTDDAGNFHFAAGLLSGAFTATVDVTACPTVTPMVAPMMGGGGAGAGSCNLCHAPAGSPGATTTPITLAN